MREQIDRNAQQSLDDLFNYIHELEAIKQSQEDELRELKTQIQELNATITSKDTEIDYYIKQSDMFNTDNEKLANQIADLETENESLKRLNDPLESKQIKTVLL